MTVLRTAGEVDFSVAADGSLEAQASGQVTQAITLEELITLSVSRGQAPSGTDAADLEHRLRSLGEAPWAEAIKSLTAHGLLVPVDALPAAQHSPLFALEAGEVEGRLLAALLDGAKNVMPLEPNELAFAAADFFEVARVEAQQFGLGSEWARATSMDLARALLTAGARRGSKSRALQFVGAGRLPELGRLERLSAGTARYLVVCRHAFGFIDEAARSLQLRDPMALYSSALHPLLAHVTGDVHEALARHYVDFARRVRELQRACPGRVLLVRHEELVARPAEAMREVTQFIGEPDAAPVEVNSPAPGAPWPQALQQRVGGIVQEGLTLLGYT